MGCYNTGSLLALRQLVYMGQLRASFIAHLGAGTVGQEANLGFSPLVVFVFQGGSLFLTLEGAVS